MALHRWTGHHRHQHLSITITGGAVGERRKGWFAAETLNPSTSTVPQAIALTTELTILSTATGGTATATGFLRNVFTLSTASAVEGQNKAIIMTGTGEAKIAFTGTATGRWVLSLADDNLMLRMLNRKWRVVNRTATTATAT